MGERDSWKRWKNDYYCEYCGTKMRISVEQIGYHTDTGSPYYAVFATCPKKSSLLGLLTLSTILHQRRELTRLGEGYEKTVMKEISEVDPNCTT